MHFKILAVGALLFQSVLAVRYPRRMGDTRVQVRAVTTSHIDTPAPTPVANKVSQTSVKEEAKVVPVETPKIQAAVEKTQPSTTNSNQGQESQKQPEKAAEKPVEVIPPKSNPTSTPAVAVAVAVEAAKDEVKTEKKVEIVQTQPAKVAQDVPASTPELTKVNIAAKPVDDSVKSVSPTPKPAEIATPIAPVAETPKKEVTPSTTTTTKASKETPTPPILSSSQSHIPIAAPPQTSTTQGVPSISAVKSTLTTSTTTSKVEVSPISSSVTSSREETPTPKPTSTVSSLLTTANTQPTSSSRSIGVSSTSGISSGVGQAPCTRIVTSTLNGEIAGGNGNDNCPVTITVVLTPTQSASNAGNPSTSRTTRSDSHTTTSEAPSSTKITPPNEPGTTITTTRTPNEQPPNTATHKPESPPQDTPTSKPNNPPSSSTLPTASQPSQNPPQPEPTQTPGEPQSPPTSSTRTRDEPSPNHPQNTPSPNPNTTTRNSDNNPPLSPKPNEPQPTPTQSHAGDQNPPVPATVSSRPPESTHNTWWTNTWTQPQETPSQTIQHPQSTHTRPTEDDDDDDQTRTSPSYTGTKPPVDENKTQSNIQPQPTRTRDEDDYNGQNTFKPPATISKEPSSGIKGTNTADRPPHTQVSDNSNLPNPPTQRPSAPSSGVTASEGSSPVFSQAPVTTRATAPIFIGSKPITKDSSSHYVIGTQTLLPGSQIEVDGDRISAAPSGGAIIVNPAEPMVTSKPAVMVVDGKTITAGPNGGFVIGDKTLYPGGAITQDGQIITLPNPDATPPPKAKLIVLGAATYTGNAGAFLLGAQTLTQGGAITSANGDVISLSPDGSAVVVNAAPRETNTFRTVTAGLLPEELESMDVAGQVLTKGGRITVGGDILSFAPSGTGIVVVGTVTVGAPKTSKTNAAVKRDGLGGVGLGMLMGGMAARFWLF